jgi:hypothetical protein
VERNVEMKQMAKWQTEADWAGSCCCLPANAKLIHDMQEGATWAEPTGA